ncbi:DUF429 domain-containing protein [Fimbriiglobus ruber]|uniref:DUF429 domain-containing protein n=1 Tax=Fimbriiglobus ruber TaxID=1908690 RepID=A0A225EDR7_9BACT|nr:DUF429 domain-containing protein [Fimbriiglobus ruber]OWK46555.1 hypothetical protein FRUB_00254 [Fimbriiglobus ruber]
MRLPIFEQFFGVDFSGAKKAGETIWVARLEPVSRSRRRKVPPFRLTSLDRLDTLAGTADRGPALRFLVNHVLVSEAALWGFDFPFGLPVELFPDRTPWLAQFAFLAEWEEAAYACGVECIRRARLVGEKMHIRRATDSDAKAPFDCYHYRIIYQTFYGMRDVVDPLRRTPGTAVLPFQYRKLRTAKRVVVECCPGSVLKKLKLPHQNYKQPAGGPLTHKRRLTRHVILDWLSGLVRFDDRFRRVMMRNPGGDAMDAVIAAAGAALAVPSADHARIARHPRYPREGFLFC